MVDYVLGIDTGGTYTEWVLIQRRTRKILKSRKNINHQT